MKSEVYPLHLPAELLSQIRRTAEDTGLSLADAMRQSLKLGLPRLHEQLAGGRVTNVEPLSKAALDKLYARRDDDMESVRLFIAAQPKDAR